jgi:UDP-N-acetylglucosamine 4-epimerase
VPSIYERVKLVQRKWLVTGGAGFIGSHLVHALLTLNQKVVVFDNLATQGPMVSTNFRNNHPNLELWNFDIRHSTSVDHACYGCDYILHHAALCSVPDSVLNPTNTYDNNVTGF